MKYLIGILLLISACATVPKPDPPVGFDYQGFSREMWEGEHDIRCSLPAEDRSVGFDEEKYDQRCSK